MNKRKKKKKTHKTKAPSQLQCAHSAKKLDVQWYIWKKKVQTEDWNIYIYIYTVATVPLVTVVTVQNFKKKFKKKKRKKKANQNGTVDEQWKTLYK